MSNFGMVCACATVAGYFKMASASTVSRESPMDPWRPRRTRRHDYQSHTYKLRTPVVSTENTSDQEAIGLLSADTKPQPPRTLNQRAAFSPTSQTEKEVEQTWFEAEDILNSDSGLHLQDISVRTMVGSPIEDQTNLATASDDILDMADQEHARNLSVNNSCTPSLRQQVRKSQAKSRKHTCAKTTYGIARKRVKPSSKCHSAAHGGPVKVKLWEPHNVSRERKHLNELDVCLSVYDQVLQDAIDKEHRPIIKEVLLRHVKLTRKVFLATIKETHMLHLIQKRYQMEKIRQRKLRRAMQSTFKGLRKGAKQQLIKWEYVERNKRLQLDDSDKETDDDMSKQLKSLLAPLDPQGMLVSESQSPCE